MKMSKLWTWAIVVVGLNFVSAARASAQVADNFCMDCAQRVSRVGGTIQFDAICCMADKNGYCSGSPNYVVSDLNVGWGCRTETIENGSVCASSQADLGCGASPGNGGTGGGGRGFGGGDDGCTTRTGYCPPSCSSCAFLF